MAGTGAAAAVAVAAGSFTSGSVETLESITGLTADATYSVYLVAEDDETVPNVQAEVVTFNVTPTIPPTVLLKADFATDLSPFTPVSVIGDKVWLNGGGYAKISGYISTGSEANEDWLISPGIDLAASTQEVLSFETANNYGDAVTTLKVKISSDFSGTYDAASIAAATWEDITSLFTLSPGGSWSFVESGAVDFSPYAVDGTGYLAFVYECDNVDPGTWEVDNIIYTGYLVPGADASLSDLQIDAATVAGFDPAVFSYTVELTAGTTAIPVVTVTTTDDAATPVITPATDLAGDAAARTTTILVTAQDGTTTASYSILFNPIIEVANIAGLKAATEFDRKYVVTGEVVLTQKDGYRNKKYFEDTSGAIEIDDAPGVITSVYVIGDGVTGINGTLEVYNGWLQMHPVSDPGAATSNGNPVVPQVLTVSEFNTNFNDYAAEFVKIEGLSFADAGASFANGGNYNVSVGSDIAVVRVHFYDIITGTIPKMADVQGVAVWHYSTAKIALRMNSDIMAYSSDASLSDLQVNTVSVDGFTSGTLSYAVLLDVGTTAITAVTYTTTDAGASAVVTNATDLHGDEAARTTTVEVTAADGTTATYTIVFTVDNTGVNNSATSRLSLYPVPATDVLYIKGMNDIRNIEIVNIVGNVVKRFNVESETMSISISDLSSGVYFIRANESTYRFIKK
ncbi:MAG: DUF5017 domain-containing protein [Bacteroidales bacterium]|nr:DUF5017 domain-containing protein [Bacteroidales bacterium]MCF8391616.1 DUF5017 domain-containing protein [Bacteroidales bacterium]